MVMTFFLAAGVITWLLSTNREHVYNTVINGIFKWWRHMGLHQCQKEGKKSKVYIGMTSTTCMGIQEYYDENGEYHSHNPNTTLTQYSCSNGHEWTESYKSKCKACGGEGK